MTRSRIAITEDQALAFRARRGHLLGRGASCAVTAARDILGAQSQQLGTSLFALSQRTRKRPTHAQLEGLLFGEDVPLIRTWGQRDTIHVYDAAAHWHAIVTARAQWSKSGRGGAHPPEALVRKTLKFLREEHRAPAARKDMQHLVSKAYLKECEEVYLQKTGSTKGAMAFAAGRILWMLANRGDTRLGVKLGAEQTSVVREAWHPELPWPKGDADAANVALVEQTLKVHAPMTVQDLAHFWGATVTSARQWVQRLEEGVELLDVSCGDRKGLIALAADRSALRRKAPATDAWPARLLPQWDALLMAHADKTWTVPDAAERKRIWKPGAVVAPIVIARGRAVATWKHRRRAKAVDVEIQPLSGWRKIRHLKDVKAEAEALAKFYGLAEATVAVKA